MERWVILRCPQQWLEQRNERSLQKAAAQRDSCMVFLFFFCAVIDLGAFDHGFWACWFLLSVYSCLWINQKWLRSNWVLFEDSEKRLTITDPGSGSVVAHVAFQLLLSDSKLCIFVNCNIFSWEMITKWKLAKEREFKYSSVTFDWRAIRMKWFNLYLAGAVEVSCTYHWFPASTELHWHT